MTSQPVVSESTTISQGLAISLVINKNIKYLVYEIFVLICQNVFRQELVSIYILLFCKMSKFKACIIINIIIITSCKHYPFQVGKCNFENREINKFSLKSC